MLLVSMYSHIHVRELPTLFFLEGILDGSLLLDEMPKESICDISLQDRKDIVYVALAGNENCSRLSAPAVQ